MDLRRSMCGLLFAPLLAAGVARTQTLAPAELASLNAPAARAVLLYFVASDCPVSNRYFPEMERLATKFAGQGVATRYVYANRTETPASVGRHQADFNAPQGEARLDSGGNLARLTGARTTPEAALLLHEGPRWRVAYLGRIDDRMVHIGLERPRAEHHDLEDAVVAALAHRPVMPAAGPPVGCAIMPAERLRSK